MIPLVFQHVDNKLDQSATVLQGFIPGWRKAISLGSTMRVLILSGCTRME